MRFPDAFLDEVKARTRLSTLIGRKVSWDKKKSQPAKGIHWACCPFHGEETPSFKADDDAGRYYCFGCRASGDAITWLVDRQGQKFAEAVSFLAQEAGLKLPDMTPEQTERETRRAALFEVNAAAAAWFAGQLKTPAAEAARTYLEKRGVPETQWTAFRLGYAPASRDGLVKHLALLKFSEADMIAAGVAKEGNTPPFTARDCFFGRLMFPIHDRSGRCVGFGGRALADDQQPKYLNTAETPVFHKGRLLYNLHRAIDPAREAKDIIAVEGYLDVIAAARAGVAHVVAPLGTAIGEEQLELLWRHADEPLICLDGDEAGKKAMGRAMTSALALLKPGKSLSFVTLPDGRDPDDVVTKDGAEAFTALLSARIPLIDALWADLASRADHATPERRMKFEAGVVAAVARIADTGVRKAYENDMAARLAAFWKSKGIKQAKPAFEKKPKGDAPPASSSGGGPSGPPNWDKEMCEAMNAHYALVINGQRAAVLCDAPEDNRGVAEGLRFWNIDAFRIYLANRLAVRGGKIMNVADLWLGDRNRRQYKGLEFIPGAPGEAVGREGYYNLFRGYAVEPRANRDLARPWLDHVRDNVADGDEDLFQWIVAWFAWTIQFPRKRSGVSLVLRGGMGTGKTIVGKIVGSLYPAHYFLIDDARFITGQFNAHLAWCMLLQADEGFWAGDKQAEGRLKGLITSNFQMVEQKGVDPIRVANYVNLMVSSNEDWVVPAGLRERRFAVIDVSANRIQDIPYFKALDEHFAAPLAKAALLHELLNWKIDESRLRKVPSTEALFSQKSRSFDSFMAWLYDILSEGKVNISEAWPVAVECRDLHQNYLRRCEKLGLRHPLAPNAFGRKLKSIVPGAVRLQDKHGRWNYLMPGLDVVRDDFCRAVDHRVNWQGEIGGMRLEQALDELGIKLPPDKPVRPFKTGEDFGE